MTATYRPLATVTLGSSAASVTFSSIPATYRDLILVFNGTATTGSSNVFGLRLNSDTGTNYSRVFMGGDGSTAYSGSGTFDYMPTNLVFSTRPLNVITQIMDYSATDKHKTSLIRGNDAGYEVIAHAQRWASTAAVNQVTVLITANAFAVGSTFNLFGVIA